MNKQRVVLVTGGMGGLGETISTKMVDAGYKLAVTYSPGNKSHAEWVAQMAERGYPILPRGSSMSHFFDADPQCRGCFSDCRMPRRILLPIERKSRSTCLGPKIGDGQTGC